MARPDRLYAYRHQTSAFLQPGEEDSACGAPAGGKAAQEQGWEAAQNHVWLQRCRGELGDVHPRGDDKARFPARDILTLHLLAQRQESPCMGVRR